MSSSTRHIALIYQNTLLPWVFEEAVARDMDITLVPVPGDRGLRRGIAPLPGVVQLLHTDIFQDPAGATAALLARHHERPFDGVITLRDAAIPFVADLAERLELPGIGREVAYAARDKSEMRRRFRGAGLNCPDFVYVAHADDWATARQLRLPVVVKPAGGYSSEGVIRVDSEDQLEPTIRQVASIIEHHLDRMAQTGDRDFSGVLVEEYIEGPEYAVDTFAVDGRVNVLSIAYKGWPKGPYFEETVYTSPAPLAETTRAAIVREVTQATLALGITTGPTHTELRLRDEADPYVLEVGARVGGSGVSHYIVSRSRGVSFVGLALDLATGVDVRGIVESAAAPPIAVSNCYDVQCQGAGTVVQIDGLQAAAEYPGVEYICQMLFPGDRVPAYPVFPGYPAFILSRHTTYAEAEGLNAFLDATIKIHYQ
jgi:biotin carboxylase